MEAIKTLSEVYKNGSDEVKELLKKRFTDEELGIEFIPKNGDVCIGKYGEMAIAKGATIPCNCYPAYCMLDKDGTLCIDNNWRPYFYFSRLATEEEKQILFDAMREKGYQWNEEEKKIEKVLWRAKRRECYYYFNTWLNIKKTIDYYGVDDLALYKRGNYFKTKEEAEKYVKFFTKALINRE